MSLLENGTQDALPALPGYVYVASSWRNPTQQDVVAALRAASIDCYDFRNPPGGTGFSWSSVKPPGGPSSIAVCEHCSGSIARATYAALTGKHGNSGDPVRWRHTDTGGTACAARAFSTHAMPKKGSDWEQVDEYLQMVNHPVAVAGYGADFAAMERADTFVMVLPCGKSAHLEIGYAIGAGKRTAILLEDPVEPELMYRGADLLARDLGELLAWMGVDQ